MFIRRTQTRSNATGERYYTYRLVRAERIQNKVRQVTLLNLGRHFAVDQALWPVRCQRIEALTTGQSCLLEPDLPVAARAEAERIEAQLLARTSLTSSLSVASADTKQHEHADVQAVDVNLLELVRPRSVGVEQTGLWAMRQIGFIDSSAYALKRLVNHKISNDVTAGYIVSDVESLRKPMEQIATQLLQYFTINEEKKILPFPIINNT